MENKWPQLLNWTIFFINAVYFSVYFYLLKNKQMPLFGLNSLVPFILFLVPFYVFLREKAVGLKKTIVFFLALLFAVSVSICVFHHFEESGLFTIWKEKKSFFDFFLELQKSNKIKNLSYARTPKGAFILFGTVESKGEIDILEKEIKEKNIPCSIRIIVEKLEN